MAPAATVRPGPAPQPDTEPEPDAPTEIAPWPVTEQEPVTEPDPEPESEPESRSVGESTRRDPVESPVPASGPDADPEPGPGDRGVHAATEAGMPIFDDEADEVAWLRHRTERPDPPPPFEEPPERPLFAPGPPDGSRTDRGRREDPSRASDTFWPWDGGQAAPEAAPPFFPDDHDDHDGPVPGRRSMATAVTLIVLVLLAVGALVAYNAGRDGDLLGSQEEPSGSPSPPDQPGEPATALPIVGVTDLDPQGDPPFEEYPELTPLAADGDPATAWRTNTYAQQFGPDGLKTGLGLVVDLGEFQDVRSVQVQVAGETALAAYVADTEPDSVGGLQRVAEASGSETVELALEEPDTGRFVVVWIDRLPQVSDGFRAEIAEITVAG